jgi:hypothetical protein
MSIKEPFCCLPEARFELKGTHPQILRGVHMKEKTGFMRVAAILFMFLATSCSGLSVMSDYDRDYDFTRQRTYRWITDSGRDSSDVLSVNPLLKNRVQSAIDRELAARGFLAARGSSAAGLEIAVRAYISEKSMIRREPAPFYPRLYWWGKGFRYYPWFDPFEGVPVLYHYDEFLLLIDMTDQTGRRMVWNGSARGLLKRYRTGEAMQKDIDFAVSEIFSDFPLQKAVRK